MSQHLRFPGNFTGGHVLPLITGKVSGKIIGIVNNGSFEKHPLNYRGLNGPITGPDKLPGLSKHGPLRPKPRRHKIVNLRTKINATKGMIENVIQLGSEPGSPDYGSETLTTRPLKKNMLATWLIIELISSDKPWEKLQYIFCNQDHLTTSSRSIMMHGQIYTEENWFLFRSPLTHKKGRGLEIDFL